MYQEEILKAIKEQTRAIELIIGPEPLLSMEALMSGKKDKNVNISRGIVNTVVKPEVQKIEFDTPSITVTVSGTPDGIDREYIYPDTVSSGIVAQEIASGIGAVLNPQQKEEFSLRFEEIQKTYLSEMEISLGPFKFKMARSPKKTVIYSKG